MSELASVLLRRLRVVHVDQAGPRPGDPSTHDGLVALEAELLERGFAPDARLRASLAWLGPAGLAQAGRELIARLDTELGVDRTHMPLFRSFPASVPDDTHEMWIDRMVTLLLQWPEQPCVLCASVGSVHAVAPCAHLVCRECWDGADYAGCPICHRRIDPADPFLRPTAPRRAAEPAAGPLKLLGLGRDVRADTVRALGTLLARRTPLPPRDRADLAVLLAHAPAGTDWYPAEIPVRETKSLVLGWMLADRERRCDAVALLATQLTTATDVLRLLCVWSGGEADLIAPPRLRSLPRPLRRTLLALLDALPTAALVEDVLRHPEPWKRAAEILHPYERHARHPRAALAFAVLRGTSLTGTGIGAVLRETAAAHPRAVRVDGDRLRAITWRGRVEQALAERDLEGALALLAQRPGELLRRLDQLLRLQARETLPDAVADVLRRVLPQAGPAPLLAAHGRLRDRHVTSERRVFFPRGRVTHAYTLDDPRPPLSPAVTGAVCALLEAEAVRRLAVAPRVEHAVLDSALTGLAVPANERADAKALVAVPRGSTQPLPRGEVMRLFLHWTQPAKTRVDLDLSVALFDERWEFTGLCDYTNLVYGERWAVHSGDLTSAPAPDGATEYVDLDLAALGGHGVRYALPVVFSYNDIPFERMLDAFAGFMTLPSAAEDARDASYDPRAVRQRYDLTGDSRVHVPLVVDLRHRTFLWTDLHLSAAEGFHNVHRHAADLGRAGRDLHQYFATGRTTLWDLAAWHAAARADTVTVLRRADRQDAGAPEGSTGGGVETGSEAGDGRGDEVWHYARRDGEGGAAFAARVRGLEAPERRERPGRDGPTAEALAARSAAGKRVLLALVAGDVAPERATGEAYRLLPGPTDGCGLTPLAAGDLVAALGSGVPLA
ncbi:MXAN_6230/SCO0854 family RING domain-containing protein [Streptomyces sp. NPDC058417]|uniref:MXAN_6230/SCO0854 family RING domain-containing protein n=1 Tax=unclassified Streptomyces TaxID=2593676 RepID=UPI003650457D